MEPERDEKGRLLPGHTANPNGRPKRKTFREYFSEEEELDLINKLKTSDKPEIWMKIAEQIFGKARQNIGLDGGSEDKPIPLLYVLDNNGNKESNEPQEEN